MSNILKILEKYSSQFISGIGITLTLALTGTLIGLLFGLVLATLRTVNIKENRNGFEKILKNIGYYFSKTYITIFRGTPMMVQAVIIFYGVRGLGVGSWWSPMFAGITVVSLNTAAYLAEVFRGGIQSLDKGQTEAARSLGFNQVQTFIYIVLPQALKNTMPSVGNEFIVNIKDTSVLSVIMITDLFYIANLAGGTTYLIVESMIIAAVIYLFLTYTISKLLMFIEKKWDMPVKEVTSSN